MATVWMRHPSLPAEQLIEVPESSVPHHQAAGWELTEAPPPKPAPSTAAGRAPDGVAAEQGEDTAEDPAFGTEAAAKPKRTRKAPLNSEES